MTDPDADSDDEFEDSPDYYSVLNVRKEVWLLKTVSSIFDHIWRTQRYQMLKAWLARLAAAPLATFSYPRLPKNLVKLNGY